MKTLTKKTQNEITPQIALDLLKEGNERFVKNNRADRNLLEQVSETASGQFPFAVLLSCIDSRTSSELIFDQGIGDIFSARVAGNVVNEDILGSMEYSCKVAGSKIVAVIGHSKCGAVTAACQDVELGNITALLSKVKPAIQNVKPSVDDITSEASVQKVADENVKVAMDEIRKKSEILAQMERDGEIKIVGGMYDVKSGEVNFFD
ncbi:MAG: carbonic anhydrase [Fluviicola sp.]|nr:MAG: carbonic anhydrase [Fluviicola sp.]